MAEPQPPSSNPKCDFLSVLHIWSVGVRDLLCETLLQHWCDLHVSNVPPTSFCFAGAEGRCSKRPDVYSGQYSLRAVSLRGDLCQQVCSYWLKIVIYYFLLSFLTHYFVYWYELFIFKAFSQYHIVYKEVRLHGFYEFLVLSIKMSPIYIFTKNTLVIYKYVTGLCCFRGDSNKERVTDLTGTVLHLIYCLYFTVCRENVKLPVL